MNLNAELSTDKLTINSSTIEIIKDKNEILFDGNVLIKSRDFVIKADKATFNNVNKIIECLPLGFAVDHRLEAADHLLAVLVPVHLH